MLLFAASCELRSRVTDTGCAQPTAPGHTAFFEPDATGDLGVSAGAVRFFSNDSSYQGVAGYSFWMFGEATGSVEDPGGLVMEARVNKISGSSASGYGIVFAVQPDGSNFYVLLVDTLGNWQVGQVTDRVYAAMGAGWTPSGGALLSGYNQTNDIMVTMRAAAAGVLIAVRLNGVDFAPVQDEDSDVLCAGAFGYIVTTAPNEPSLSSSVDVRFATIVPADLHP